MLTVLFVEDPAPFFPPLLFKVLLQIFKLLQPAFRSPGDERDTEVFTAKEGKTNEISDLLRSNLSLTPCTREAGRPTATSFLYSCPR